MVGKSGSGKTTLFDVLLRLLEIEKGSIKIDEVSLYDIASDDLVNGISRVAQNTFLFPGTIRENLLIVKEDATDDELNEVIKLSGLDEFISQLSQGIDTDIEEDGVTISGGQKQRIGLARGFLKGVKILLLDGVTGNVDRENEMKIITNILEIMKEKDLTVISISHKPEFFEFADRILKMENGKLVSI
ncbi:ABC transporter ATP-binding protein [Proteiniborus sp. MB09-C3]|nr:ABC transporter ATP-binding protein [Proteiniborus sp. MB09-C3]WIV13924.1 ABC transporter ATP-binding protein [Proteiniborus sp. MB09-C3]